MLRIKFKYRDVYSYGEWKEQECVCKSVSECKEVYGLGIDPTCEYRILSVTPIGTELTRQGGENE